MWGLSLVTRFPPCKNLRLMVHGFLYWVCENNLIWPFCLYVNLWTGDVLLCDPLSGYRQWNKWTTYNRCVQQWWIHKSYWSLQSGSSLIISTLRLRLFKLEVSCIMCHLQDWSDLEWEEPTRPLPLFWPSWTATVRSTPTGCSRWSRESRRYEDTDSLAPDRQSYFNFKYPMLHI